MISHFCDHSHCSSRDIMLLVVEKEDSKCSCFNLLILFISKSHGLKVRLNNPNPGHTRLRQQSEKNITRSWGPLNHLRDEPPPVS